MSYTKEPGTLVCQFAGQYATIGDNSIYEEYSISMQL